MARPGVSYLDVAQAANAIQAANEYPSIERIRQKLGTGSSTTIANHLKQWKAEYMPSVINTPKTTLPIPLLTQLQSFWDELRHSAQQTFEDKETEYKETISTLNETLSSQKTALESANQKEEEQQQTIAEQQHIISELAESKIQQEEAINTLNAEITTQTNRINSQSETIDTLKEQLKNVTSSLEHFHAAAQKQRDEETLKHASAVNRLEQMIHTFKQQKETDNQKQQQLLLNNERNDFKIEQLTLENDQIKSQLVTKIEESATYKAKLEDNIYSYQTLETRFNESDHTCSILQKKLNALELQHRDVTRDKQALIHESALKDEKMQNLMEKLNKHSSI